jgi:hypothetical protein
MGLGWIELGLARHGRAVRHFTRALKLAPDTSDAVAGLVASRPFDFTEGKSVAGISEGDLDDRLVALIAGLRLAAASDWDAVAALDAELGRIGPGEVLFEEASRLRARWRLATEDPEACAEAQAIVEVLLSRSWNPMDALLRARAAIAADRPAAAWGSLSRIAELPRANDQAGVLIERALEIAEAWPEEIARDLRIRLRSGPTAQPGSELTHGPAPWAALTDQPAPRGTPR